MQISNPIITGFMGFIGSKVAQRLNDFVGIDIRASNYLEGQTVQQARLNYADHNHVFHFGSPSSQILFEQSNEPIIDTITGFDRIIDDLKGTKTKLIYPSTASIYSKIKNEYAMTKELCERMVEKSKILALGFRISAGYGFGEDHKGEYASIIHQWIKKAKNGEVIEIYGDGTQSRDYIFIDDIVDGIFEGMEIAVIGLENLCSGIQTTHNQIIEEIAKYYPNIKVEYIKKPYWYADHTICRKPNWFTPKITIQEGIRRLCEKY